MRLLVSAFRDVDDRRLTSYMIGPGQAPRQATTNADATHGGRA